MPFNDFQILSELSGEPESVFEGKKFYPIGKDPKTGKELYTIFFVSDFDGEAKQLFVSEELESNGMLSSEVLETMPVDDEKEEEFMRLYAVYEEAKNKLESFAL